jgi:poly-gamma-glutamate synthesis protein (capsule biosynthesis protein)
MIGRGIDQVLPWPCAPELRESHVKSARDYVALAERAYGPIPRAVGASYVWGDSLEEFGRVCPAARIVNLETSITRSDDFAFKGINYRVSPENASCLAAAHVDCCVLANNHVLDFGVTGLSETLAALHRLNIPAVGAGRNFEEAAAPASIDLGGGQRVIVVACCTRTSGVPSGWAAGAAKPGVHLSDLSAAHADRIVALIRSVQGPNDIVVVSIHWGPNWGYDVPQEQQNFGRRLIDGGAHIVHGHSSHHAKAMEAYHNGLILYGCGDFITDYEGIAGHERFRGDLSVMYFATIDAEHGALVEVEMVPLRMRGFRLRRTTPEDCEWLQRRLDQESMRFGVRVDLRDAGRLACRQV